MALFHTVTLSTALTLVFMSVFESYPSSLGKRTDGCWTAGLALILRPPPRVSSPPGGVLAARAARLGGPTRPTPSVAAKPCGPRRGQGRAGQDRLTTRVDGMPQGGGSWAIAFKARACQKNFQASALFF